MMTAPHEFTGQTHETLPVRLQTAVDYGGGYAAVGRALDRAESTIRKWCRGSSQPDVDEAVRLARHAGVDFLWLATGAGQPTAGADMAQVAHLNYHPDLPTHQRITGMGTVLCCHLDRVWLTRILGVPESQAGLVAYEGDVMPDTFSDGEVLLCHLHPERIYDGLYLVHLYGQTVLRRIQRRQEGEILVTCDNVRYEDQAWPEEAMKAGGQLEIIARVVWSWTPRSR